MGTDMLIYGMLSYERAVNMSFLNFMNAGWYESWGILVKAVMWLAANLTHSSYWYFFVLQLFTVVPLLVAAHCRVGDWMPLSVMVYALVFYPQSFNLMRQFIAMGFVLLSFGFAHERKPAQFVACVLVGAGFHSSALIGLGVYPVVSYGRKNRFSSGLKMVIAGGVACGILCFAPSLLEWFSSLFNFYSAYISGEAVAASASLLSVLEFVLVILFVEVVGGLFLARCPVKESTVQLSMLVLFSAALCFLSLISKWLYRISLYYMYFALLLVPEAAMQIEDRITRYVFVGITVAALVCFSFIYFGVQGQNEVVPYVFATIYSR